jgi:hypothetical protein
MSFSEIFEVLKRDMLISHENPLPEAKLENQSTSGG